MICVLVSNFLHLIVVLSQCQHRDFHYLGQLFRLILRTVFSQISREVIGANSRFQSKVIVLWLDERGTIKWKLNSRRHGQLFIALLDRGKLSRFHLPAIKKIFTDAGIISTGKSQQLFHDGSWHKFYKHCSLKIVFHTNSCSVGYHCFQYESGDMAGTYGKEISHLRQMVAAAALERTKIFHW